jgi:hypothetical protein
MAFARQLQSLLAASLIALPAAAQNPTRPALTKVDQTAMSIDLLWNVRAAVTRFQEEKRLTLYGIASQRITDCALLYSILSNDPKGDADTRAALRGASIVYQSAASFIFPEPLAAFKVMVDKALPRLEKMKGDPSQMNPFLRGCKALSGTEDEAYRIVSAWAQAAP